MVCVRKVRMLCHLKMVQTSQLGYLLLAAMAVLFLYTLWMDEAYPYHDPDIHHPHIPQSVRGPSSQPPPKSIGYCNVYNISKGYKADFDCIKTSTSPPTTVCVYPEWRDMFISHDIKRTGTWEWHLLRDFQEVLSREPDMGVLDIGANVGFYTMVAANMGHKVVAVEPFLESCYRVHRAVQIEQVWDRVTLLRNAVADRRMVATVRESGDNQGDVQIKMEHEPCIGSCPATINTILLNDLLEVTNFTQAIIKLDVQGFEHRAFAHADQLLDKVHVPYIFMEWLMMKRHFVDANHTSTEKYILEDTLKFLFDRKYRPYSLMYDGGGPLDPDHWDSWPHDIVWHKMPLAEEKEQVLINHFLNWPR